MKADEPIAAYEFRGGAFRGTTLTLFPGRLAHEGVDVVESIPIAHVASVRVEFRREARKLNWSIALFALALVLFVAAGPLQAWSAAAAAEVTEQAQRENTTAGVSGVLQSTFRTLDQFGRLLPMAGWALVACVAALLFFFWLGSTTLTLTVAAVERAYAARGRDQQLFEFAEELSVRLGEKR